MVLQTGGLAAEQYYKIDQGWLYRLWNSRYLAGKAFVWGSNPPPLYGGLWVKPRPIQPAEKVEVSKVQLLVSEHMFGQVVMRVYNGNLGDSRRIP